MNAFLLPAVAAILTAAVVLLLAFLLVANLGDPLAALLSADASQAERAALVKQLQLDQPLWLRTRGGGRILSVARDERSDDDYRAFIKERFGELRAMGIKTVMITGAANGNRSCKRSRSRATLMAAGRELGVANAGYYAINALRLEKAYRAFGPELNPDERLNADLKQAIGSKVPVRTKAKLRAAANEHMQFIAANRDRVRAYFQDPIVKYAA